MYDDEFSGLPTRQLSVFPADQFCVTHGVNRRDPLGIAEDLELDDVYQLSQGMYPVRIALTMSDDGQFSVAGQTGVGTPGAPIFLDCLVRFSSPERKMIDALVLVETDPQTGDVAQVYLHPFDRIDDQTPYTLLTVDRDNTHRRLAEAASAAFTRGTHITMADGRQVPVEDLRPGDRVLTRDSGAQVVRWVGIETMRAEGAFAPVVIAAGALNNDHDLVVSPNHRLFIYQRVDALGTGQRELLVKAGLLINGASVTQSSGGYVDYVQLLFDKHEIVYAEGIAAESLFVDTATRPALPDAIAEKLTPERATDFPLGAVELSARDLKRRQDAVDMLRRVSAL